MLQNHIFQTRFAACSAIDDDVVGRFDTGINKNLSQFGNGFEFMRIVFFDQHFPRDIYCTGNVSVSRPNFLFAPKDIRRSCINKNHAFFADGIFNIFKVALTFLLSNTSNLLFYMSDIPVRSCVKLCNHENRRQQT